MTKLEQIETRLDAIEYALEDFIHKPAIRVYADIITTEIKKLREEIPALVNRKSFSYVVNGIDDLFP